MKRNRVILAIAGAVGIALAGACADGAKLTSPASRAPTVSATVGDTFCCARTQLKTATTTDTFPKHGN